MDLAMIIIFSEKGEQKNFLKNTCLGENTKRNSSNRKRNYTT